MNTTPDGDINLTVVPVTYTHMQARIDARPCCQLIGPSVKVSVKVSAPLPTMNINRNFGLTIYYHRLCRPHSRCCLFLLYDEVVGVIVVVVPCRWLDGGRWMVAISLSLARAGEIWRNERKSNDARMCRKENKVAPSSRRSVNLNPPVHILRSRSQLQPCHRRSPARPLRKCRSWLGVVAGLRRGKAG